MSADPFDTITKSLDPPLVIVTTAAGDERAGCLVGFHSQSSIDPLRYCVWLSKANHTFRVAMNATHLAVHFLTSSDFALAEHFGSLTGDDTDKFATVATHRAETGVPVLSGCSAHVVGEVIDAHDNGCDHVCFTTRLVHVEASGRFEPLRLSRAGQLTPGHES